MAQIYRVYDGFASPEKEAIEARAARLLEGLDAL